MSHVDFKKSTKSPATIFSKPRSIWRSLRLPGLLREIVHVMTLFFLSSFKAPCLMLNMGNCHVAEAILRYPHGPGR